MIIIYRVALGGRAKNGQQVARFASGRLGGCLVYYNIFPGYGLFFFWCVSTTAEETAREAKLLLLLLALRASTKG